MSLSADEKLRLAHRLDALGIHLIEAGFPSSNPKELELFSLLAAERFDHAQIAAFGMTRRRDVVACDDPALRVLADSFAPVCTLVGKSWKLHLEKVVRVDAEENLRMIADSVAFLAGEGKRVIYDAEHFFDGYADDARYALQCLTRGGGGRRRDGRALRHQRRHAARRRRGDDARGHDRARPQRRPGRDPLPRRRRLRGGQLARRRRRGSHARPGHAQRLRGAVWQRQPDLDHPEPAAQARPPVRARRAAGAADRDGALRRRAPELHPEPQPALRRAQRIRAQGRDARRRRQRRSGHLRASRSGRGRQRRASC